MLRALQAHPVLCFDHIPKTAGSTLRTILWRQYAPRRVHFSMEPAQHVARFQALHEQMTEDPGSVEVIVSHAGHGFHTMLPDDRTYQHFTFLRDPIERVISGFHMFKRQGRVPASMRLDTFVRTNLKPGCNMMTSSLSGYFWECHRDGNRMPELEAFTEAMLEQAKANMDRQVVVGLTERFDASLLLLQRAFGWHQRGMYYERVNVGRAAPQVRYTQQYSHEELRVAEEYNALDIELYAYAKRRFQAQIDALDVDIEEEVRRFQQRNRLYTATVSPILNAMRPIVRALRNTVAYHGRLA